MCMNADRGSPIAQLNSSASCSCTMLRFPKSATQRNMLHRGMHRCRCTTLRFQRAACPSRGRARQTHQPSVSTRVVPAR